MAVKKVEIEGFWKQVELWDSHFMEMITFCLHKMEVKYRKNY
jgi:hypothetical protein